MGARARGGAIAILPAMLLAVLASGCTTWRHGSVPLATALGGGVDDLDPASLALTAERTAQALAQAPERRFVLAGREHPSSMLLASARHVAAVAARESDPDALTKRLAADCRAWAAGQPAKITAYYEPVLQARRRRDERFRYPLYRQPSATQLESLKQRLGRVPTRRDIDGDGVLDGLGLELAWVDDPVSRFFLQVQGSGRLVFRGGDETRVGYAGTNGYPYVSVGARMLDLGLLERGHASATAMQRWLREHPGRRDALLFSNPRYVFFRDTAAEGPVGALGTTLVAGRSIATDDRHLPRGAMVWMRTTRPVVDDDGGLVGRKPLTRFAFAQDAGAAIQGPARIDLFYGSGPRAGLEAGGMNEQGEVFVLLCRPGARRSHHAMPAGTWWRRRPVRSHSRPAPH